MDTYEILQFGAILLLLAVFLFLVKYDNRRF